MPYMISGNITDLGLPVARPVVAMKGDHTNQLELGQFLSRNVSGYDGVYILGLGGFSDQVIVVGLDIDQAPRSQPDAIDWKTPVVLGDRETEVLVDIPEGFWRLFELSGSTAQDSSGNNNAGSYIGVLLGQPALTPAGTGFSAYIDVTANARVVTPSVMSTLTNPDFAFECWYQSSVKTRIMNLWDRVDIGSSTRRMLVALNKQQGNFVEGYVTVTLQGPSADLVNITTTNHNPYLTDGNPHFIAVSKTGNTVDVYFDGAWQEVLGSVTISGPFHNGQGHYMGCGATFLAGEKFEGYLSEVAFFNTALSSERVRQHYASSF